MILWWFGIHDSVITGPLDVFLMSQNLWFEWFAVIGLIVMIFIFGEYGPAFDPQQFIYFQF